MEPGVSLLHSLLFVIVLLAVGQERAAAPERFEETRFEFTEIHMAMPVRIVMFAPDSTRARSSAKSAFRRIASLEATMSDYRAQSELRQFAARHGEWVPVSPDLHAVLARSVEIAVLTNGAFDPTVGALVALWRDARRTGVRPTDEAVNSARAQTGWRRIALDSSARTARLTKSTKLDLGAIAKGFIIGEAAATLREEGIRSLMIEAGGDIVVGDAPPGQQGWHIEVPGASPEFARHASRLENMALATSGPANQFVDIGGVRYSHVVDPRTGMALTRSTTSWVIAKDGALADALATALTVLDAREREVVMGRFAGVIVDVRAAQ
jgi:thiamine biosynthesis lipoprotein